MQFWNIWIPTENWTITWIQDHFTIQQTIFTIWKLDHSTTGHTWSSLDDIIWNSFFSCSYCWAAVFWLLVTYHVLELHNCPKNLECELSFLTETFVIETKPLLICWTVRKPAKRTWDTTVETTLFPDLSSIQITAI